MAPKPAGRPATKQLPDIDAIAACAAYSDARGPHPYEALAEWPKNLIAAKLAKLERRGLVKTCQVTRAGREALEASPE
jgi:hypothetical protein